MKILLAIAHPDLRLSLELLLSEEPGVHILGTVSESDGLLALIHITHPDVVISEWDLPGRPLPEIMHEMTHLTQKPKFIVLTTQFEADLMALEAGAHAISRKGDPPEQLITTFRKLRFELND